MLLNSCKMTCEYIIVLYIFYCFLFDFLSLWMDQLVGEGELLRILCSYGKKNCFNKPSAGEFVSAYTG